MLILSLIVSAILLALANVVAYRSNRPGAPILCYCLLFLIGPPFLSLMLLPVALLAGL